MSDVIWAAKDAGGDEARLVRSDEPEAVALLRATLRGTYLTREDAAGLARAAAELAGLTVVNPTEPAAVSVPGVAPKIPDWLVEGANEISGRFCPPGVSLLGLISAAWVVCWDEARKSAATGEVPA